MDQVQPAAAAKAPRRTRGAAVAVVPAPPGPDEIWIPRHDGVYPRMGSGDGAMIDGTEVVTMVRASERGLRQRLGATPHTGIGNLRLVTAHGDSMRGTFEEGDLLLVDTGVNEVRGDGVYVLRGPDTLLIKRVQKRGDGSWLLLSDNPLYPPDPVPREARADYAVLGRVLLAWATRTV
jgi:phage repressor protein C with HTH and peptisase S24 domain